LNFGPQAFDRDFSVQGLLQSSMNDTHSTGTDLFGDNELQSDPVLAVEQHDG
jgi:hypothetical protein